MPQSNYQQTRYWRWLVGRMFFLILLFMPYVSSASPHSLLAEVAVEVYKNGEKNDEINFLKLSCVKTDTSYCSIQNIRFVGGFIFVRNEKILQSSKNLNAVVNYENQTIQFEFSHMLTSSTSNLSCFIKAHSNGEGAKSFKCTGVNDSAAKIELIAVNGSIDLKDKIKSTKIFRIR